MRNNRLSVTQDLWQYLGACRRPVVLYGMGNGADKVFARLSALGIPVAGVVASDDFVRGQTFHGMTVYPVSRVRDLFPDAVVLLCFGSRLPGVIGQVERLCAAVSLYVPDLPLAGDAVFDLDFALAHADALSAAYERLADDLSRAVFESTVYARLTGRVDALVRCTQTHEEMLSLLPADCVRRALDGGAYTGDTLRQMFIDFPNLEHVIAVEPDARNFRKLSDYVKKYCQNKASIYQSALWNCAGNAVLHGSGNRNSSLHGASHVCREENVPLCTVDSLCGERLVDFIKYDVEGAEREALLGSVGTIGSARPILRVAAYHRAQDLFALPLLLDTLYPGCRLYLRRARTLPAWDMDFFVFPPA